MSNKSEFVEEKVLYEKIYCFVKGNKCKWEKQDIHDRVKKGFCGAWLCRNYDIS